MKIKIALLIISSFFLVSCATIAPPPTSTPLPKSTLTDTPAAVTTGTPIPTSTPRLLEGIVPKELPAGEPVASWRDIPVMPGAIHGDAYNAKYYYGGDERYSFTIQATQDEILNYYVSALTKIGAKPQRGILQGTNVQMVMGELDIQKIIIWIIPYQDFMLVVLTESVPSI